MKEGEQCWFEWSASYAHQVEFVRWCRMKMHTGEDDTNKIGVGAILYSDWLFSSRLMNSRQRGGLPPGFCTLAPYHNLYRKNLFSY